jgi:hypothetical protein
MMTPSPAGRRHHIADAYEVSNDLRRRALFTVRPVATAVSSAQHGQDFLGDAFAGAHGASILPFHSGEVRQGIPGDGDD